MVLAGCGQPVASSIGWTASENASGTAKPVVSISSSLPANVDRGVAANQKQATGDGDSKAVSVTGKAVASALAFFPLSPSGYDEISVIFK